MLEKIRKYRKAFSPKKLTKRLPDYFKSIGLKSVYTVLLLFFAFKRNETPTWAKNIIIGVLGYLLTPLDGIPDVTPFLGMTDDIGVLSFGLVTIACYINDEIKDKAKDKLKSWFGHYDASELALIDEKL
jgi:uncharacterized membrane protein YkvA (DUF1232 family)